MNYKSIIKAGAVTAVAAVSFSSGAFAQKMDTTYTYVPFRVNVDDKITAVQGVDTVSMNVTGKSYPNADTLKFPREVSISNAVRYMGGTRGKMNAPTVTGSRGNITLRLPTQSYRNAEVALHSVNGKRVMRGKADVSESVSSVSRKNVAAGVYLLSVKGIDGNAFTARLTHSGGNMNINVAFGVESSPARQLGKQAVNEDGKWNANWEITVSAVEADKYYVYTDTLDIYSYCCSGVYSILVSGKATPTKTSFTDERDGNEYKKVTIGKQTWMAENLSYNTISGTICYDYSADSCEKYGRLYRWNTVMNGESGSSANPSGVQGICPAGWHIPSLQEWDELTDYVGNAGEKAGEPARKLKATSGWNNDRNGTDEYGFSALPGGGVTSSGQKLYIAGNSGVWWSAQEAGDDGLLRILEMGVTGGPMSHGRFPKSYYLSVRCVQDVD
jgi:uncharacterized protein (TIGR02145 family)